MSFANFDTKIMLISVTKSKGTSGGPKDTPAFVANIWGEVNEDQTEGANQMAIVGTGSVKCTIHRRSDITRSHLIVIDGQIYNIRGTKKIDRLYMEIQADEYDSSQTVIDLVQDIINLNSDLVEL